MNRNHLSAACAAALMSMGQPGYAATALGEYFTFSGFGTVGAVQTNSDEGKFGRDRQVGGADKSVSFDVDSNLGLQLTGTATPWLSATVQALAAKRDKDYLEADIEWAFVKIKPLSNLSIRAGRMAAPVFAISDTRNVGYANTWVRAPNEVYALNLFHVLNGADITYRQTLGPVALVATGFGGKSSFIAFGGADADCENIRGLNLQLETAWATFRYGKVDTKVVIPAIREKGDPYTFSGYGITVDRDNIVAQAEKVRRTSQHQPTGVNADSWYVMAGYRFGVVLPYFIVSNTEPQYPRIPFYVSAVQKTKAIGVRWDAFNSAALKFQIDRIDTDNSKGISFDTPSVPPGFPGAPPGNKIVTKPVTAISIALDFTF